MKEAIRRSATRAAATMFPCRSGFSRDRHPPSRDIAPHAHPSGFDLRGPDLGFVELARGLGVEAARVRRPAEAAVAVRRMLSHEGPYLIDLNTA